ncbi:CKLF-like MARVEL transmembrane domain-containing protein 7 [Bubalus kerabau]|nr:CKLF-like MARVEL transmembrane domain-containing protein 7 [Bubalus carabanensis]
MEGHELATPEETGVSASHRIPRLVGAGRTPFGFQAAEKHPAPPVAARLPAPAAPPSGGRGERRCPARRAETSESRVRDQKHNLQATLLIAFICVRSSLWTSYSAYSYFEVVTICNLIMILAFYLAHLFRLPRVLTCISWPLSELLHYLIGTLLLLIASIVAASKSYSQNGLVAGAVFGFLATFLCLASVWLSYKISCVTQSTDAA